MTYTPDGQLAMLTAVNAVTGDQTTRYVYGSTLASSYVARSDLLVAEIYPDSDDSQFDDGDDAVPDRIEYTYNRQGQRKSRKDQNGTLRGFLFDKLGRLVHDYVEVLAQGVDGRVRRITREYGCANRLISISAYTHPCARTGAVVNQLLMGYNAHGLLSAEYQSHTGPVNMAATPKVEYAYDDTAESGEFVKGLRPTRVAYPSGRIVRYEYGDAASSSSGPAAADPDDCLNRVKFIADDDEGEVGTHLAEYRYLGLGAIVTEDYAEPRVKLDYTPDGYSGFDRFGRVIDHRWQDYATGQDLDRYQYAHDRAGNRTSRRNATTTERDEHYLYDGLYRLVRADRGNLDPAMQRIAGTPERQESWTLDATGNWARHIERESGAVTQDQQRTHNRANELLSFSAAVGDPWSSPSHDRNGNMTRIPKPASPRESFTLRWDAWDRLTKVSDSHGVIAEYQYDPRGFRIASHTYRDPAQPDTVLTNPVSREFYHNTRWQVLEERTADAPSLPSLHYIWSLRYIDTPILRDRRVLGESSSPSERLYYLGDANFNVTALVSPAGAVQERYTYTAYGNVTILTPTWSAPRASSAFDNTVLYTGRQRDADTGIYYYRARYYGANLVAFIHRDPSRLTDRGNLYRYCRGNPLSRTDPSGQTSRTDIGNGLLVYSCNCGWIDWTHVGTMSAGIWKQVSNPGGTTRSLRGGGHKVSAKLGTPFVTSVDKAWYVVDGLTASQQKQVALALFRELILEHEKKQAGWSWFNRSGFSVEDMPSNLIGFYMDVEGITRAQVEELCGVLGKEDSLLVWDEGIGVDGNMPNVQNEWISAPPSEEPYDYWQPGWFHVHPRCAEKCAGHAKKWPAKLSNIRPAPKGTLWRDWRTWAQTADLGSELARLMFGTYVPDWADETIYVAGLRAD